MTLPASVRAEVESSLGPVRHAHPVGGGCVHPALRVELGGGRLVFLKYDPQAQPGLFAREAEGLERLRAAGAPLRVPEVLALRDAPAAPHPWLALEWLEPAPRAGDYGERLGRGLALLHRAPLEGWGWPRDGFIGPLPQENRPTATWADFWAERRLEPQLRLAREAGAAVGAAPEWERLLSRLPTLLSVADEEGPSLLHGDLWSGNVLSVRPGAAEPAHGEPALVDPAAYHGHREVDLAMSELFGGFSQAFYAAYQEVWPLPPGYAPVRRAVYQLYYLLVHVNLFGSGYAAQTRAALRSALTGV